MDSNIPRDNIPRDGQRPFAEADWRASITEWAGQEIARLSQHPAETTKKCRDIDDAKSLPDHVACQNPDPHLSNVWLWHGGCDGNAWIRHSTECWRSTNIIMQDIEKMEGITGLPSGWWSILQHGNMDISVFDDNTKSRLKNRVYERETMYQDVGDATFYFVALGIINMPKALVNAYSAMTTAYLLCEVGSDYDAIPLRDLQYAWAYGLASVAADFCDAKWVRLVYIPTLLGVAVRKSMGRKPYNSGAANLDPIAWYAARLVHSGSLAVVGALLYHECVWLDDATRLVQAAAMALAHDVFEEMSDVETGDCPNITPAVRQLWGCDGLTAYVALLCSNMLCFVVKRACVGWTLATLEGRRWAKSAKRFDFRKVQRGQENIATVIGVEPLGEEISAWQRCECDRKKEFPDDCTLTQLAAWTRQAYLDATERLECWCAYDRAYAIIVEGYASFS
ncbi:unnamed protein product [Clonostachys rosea]|uniref:Uncharacterized protein n=1 Tax=Bionectria ochroleuca TaxID=29856 RepID=A0ABY6TUJ3_BIOOC|nr:unnamed protein product [Clonostachys rosea]